MRPTSIYAPYIFMCRRMHTQKRYVWLDSIPSNVPCSEPKCTLKSFPHSLPSQHNTCAPATFYMQHPQTGRIYTPSGPIGKKMTRKLKREGYILKEIHSDRD